MKKFIYILILSMYITLTLAQEQNIEINHSRDVDCQKDKTNPKCMELWDVLETLS